ncbi:MAG: hypothetical protein COB66_07345 [Coxiella sp. (in: Bacteria)]|nr:MAG: hypothetical protein COB66_07345 [Coxiella sp. (in: g-proteobacteria)]
MAIKPTSLSLACLLITAYAVPTFANNCHPLVDMHKPQLIIGYGSLMQEASKKRSDPDVSANYPVLVRGFKRGWFLYACNDRPGFSTTYLGVTPNPDAHINAVVYKLNGAKTIQAYDAREKGYCRVRVKPSDIKFLALLPKNMQNGQIWIYNSQQGLIKTPTKNCPIVQSYVDIFLSGCLELQKKYTLPGFAKQCITTTSDWSSHWVNDRLYPRRPFIYQPEAGKIDTLIHDNLPVQFKHIKIAR